MTAWRPISEAPRDGEVVIVSDGFSVWTDAVVNGHWWDDYSETEDGYSHWQPLPEPPVAEG